MVKRSREDFDNLSTIESGDSPKSATDFQSSSSLSDIAIYNSESSKLLHLDTGSGKASQSEEVMRCSLPPHAQQALSFATFEDYEVHYNKTHVNRCIECRKNFPTPHFLDLHISENHSPLTEVLRERGERTYACFVEDCDRKCSTPQKRRMHLIDKHMFPKEYDFYIVNDGIDQRSSMLRSGRHRRRNSAAQHKIEIEDRNRQRMSTNSSVLGKGTESQDSSTNDGSETIQSVGSGAQTASVSSRSQIDAEMNDLSRSMSALKFVPASIRFGRGKGKSGLSKT